MFWNSRPAELSSSTVNRGAAGVVVVPVADKSAWQALMAPLYAKQKPEIQKLIERVKAVK